ncbi:hypothetical protein FA13DRAFT_1788037 [Coprinellus micaceus]|uniref:Protein-lysine N-methyltransferase EFM6 n=1 Tax=Coprinellus micaceus TaxID=71717 RepID=A0A4Y7TNB0_COPMI|nr:hypothetical protein FA13DRAFT_1788037 [Coprinellus micaceus]
MGVRVEPSSKEAVAELIRDEELDTQDPLRHLMDLEDGGILKLSFSHDLAGVPRPLEITLAVDASPGCGGIAWPAGQILATYLVQRGSDCLRKKNVLELGAGTGLVGLVAGHLPESRVWITDQEPILPIMQKNVQMNRLTENVFVAKLDWCVVPAPPTFRFLDYFSGAFRRLFQYPNQDIILAADCVYFEPAFPLLVETLDELSGTSTEILFCYKKRRKADKRFFNMLKKRFRWEEVMDDPNREFYNKEAITLMRLFKR